MYTAPPQFFVPERAAYSYAAIAWELLELRVNIGLGGRPLRQDYFHKSGRQRDRNPQISLVYPSTSYNIDNGYRRENRVEDDRVEDERVDGWLG